MITGTVNAQRQIIVPVSVRCTGGPDRVVDAILDTGFNGALTLPPGLIATLGLAWRSRSSAVLANGVIEPFDIYAATVLWDGTPRPILVEALDCNPLLGMALLMGCNLRVQVVLVALLKSKRFHNIRIMSTATAPRPGTGRGYFWAGILLSLAAFGLVVLQYRLQHLVVPWQLSVVTTLGAAALLVSVVRRRTVPRLVALVLVGALAGLEWYFLAAHTRIAPYTGPAQAGQDMPAFSTLRADGRSFTHQDLNDGRNHVVVFFRGRW